MGRLERVEPVIPEENVRQAKDGMLEILAWRGDPEVKAICGADGELKLESIELSAWQVIRSIALLGGWLGRKRDPIGTIVLMRGMLRFLGTLALLDQVGLDGVRNMARSLSQALGLPLPGVSEPLRKPRRPSQPSSSARLAADV